MNKSILNLFEHTRKEANDKLRHFNNDIYSTIPYIKHPEEESELFDEDIVENQTVKLSTFSKNTAMLIILKTLTGIKSKK